MSAVEVWKSPAFGILATRMNAPSVMDTVLAWYLELSVHLSVPGGLSVSNFDGGKLSAVFFFSGRALCVDICRMCAQREVRPLAMKTICVVHLFIF